MDTFTGENEMHIDVSALPLVALIQWAKANGFLVKSDNGRVYFEAAEAKNKS